MGQRRSCPVEVPGVQRHELAACRRKLTIGYGYLLRGTSKSLMPFVVEERMLSSGVEAA